MSRLYVSWGYDHLMQPGVLNACVCLTYLFWSFFLINPVFLLRIFLFFCFCYLMLGIPIYKVSYFISIFWRLSVPRYNLSPWLLLIHVLKCKAWMPLWWRMALKEPGALQVSAGVFGIWKILRIQTQLPLIMYMLYGDPKRMCIYAIQGPKMYLSLL